MSRCCEIIKYWFCCYIREDDDYDIQAYIDWSNDDTLYGAVQEHKENNDTN